MPDIAKDLKNVIKTPSLLKYWPNLKNFIGTICVSFYIYSEFEICHAHGCHNKCEGSEKKTAKYKSRLLWHKRSKCHKTGSTEVGENQDELIPKVKEFRQISQLNPQRLEYLDYSYNIKPDTKKWSNIYCDWNKRLKMSHKEIMTLPILPKLEILLQVLKCLVYLF